ncbi:MAG: S-layer homology domain-containing protein, partial [Tissierellia bacterium]|nr:S-layer homology domain-containing protein [Tissierellia bacterium]
MKRKFLSLVLALVMVLGTVSAVFAETTPLTTNDAKVQWLVDNKVVVGRTVNKDDTNPDLALDKTITRAEVSKLLVYTLGQEKLADVLKGAIKVFPDVDLDHWANGYVSVLATNRTKVASGRDVVIGYEDGTFRPSNDVTYAELATMLVRIVKKDLTKKMEDEAIWATSYIRWAEELGILEGITLVNSDAPAVRKDAFVMIYNAMHKLNLVGKNKVDWGIKIGVVSKLQAGKMEINQDKEQVYNFTYDTVVTNGTNWNEVNVNTVVPGSLVRFIADE